MAIFDANLMVGILHTCKDLQADTLSHTVPLYVRPMPHSCTANPQITSERQSIYSRMERPSKLFELICPQDLAVMRFW